jgi:hypothetical protein
MEWASSAKNGRLRDVTVVVMMMAVVTDPGGERGTCEYHQKQSGYKQFLHRSNPSMRRFADGSARSRYVPQK